MFSREADERARTQLAYGDLQGRLARERALCERQVDADRRHEARLVRMGEAIRSAVASHGDLFSDDADVSAMATAAVAAYERGHGR
jgi:hypothetical protein